MAVFCPQFACFEKHTKEAKFPFPNKLNRAKGDIYLHTFIPKRKNFRIFGMINTPCLSPYLESCLNFTPPAPDDNVQPSETITLALYTSQSIRDDRREAASGRVSLKDDCAAVCWNGPTTFQTNKGPLRDLKFLPLSLLLMCFRQFWGEKTCCLKDWCPNGVLFGNRAAEKDALSLI